MNKTAVNDIVHIFMNIALYFSLVNTLSSGFAGVNGKRLVNFMSAGRLFLKISFVCL